MLPKTSLKFLEEFMNSSSPSGFEEEAAACFRNYLAPCCDEVKADVLGNTMAVLNPGAPMRVMLAGHYDEIGFQIVYISDEGLLYFRPNGGISGGFSRDFAKKRTVKPKKESGKKPLPFQAYFLSSSAAMTAL